MVAKLIDSVIVFGDWLIGDWLISDWLIGNWCG